MFRFMGLDPETVKPVQGMSNEGSQCQGAEINAAGGHNPAGGRVEPTVKTLEILEHILAPHTQQLYHFLQEEASIHPDNAVISFKDVFSETGHVN